MANKLVEFIKENPIVLLVVFFIVYLIHNKKNVENYQKKSDKDIRFNMDPPKSAIDKFVIKDQTYIPYSEEDIRYNCWMGYMSPNALANGEDTMYKCLYVTNKHVQSGDPPNVWNNSIFSADTNLPEIGDHAAVEHCKTGLVVQPSTEQQKSANTKSRYWCGVKDGSARWKYNFGNGPICMRGDTFDTCKRRMYQSQKVLYKFCYPIVYDINEKLSDSNSDAQKKLDIRNLVILDYVYKSISELSDRSPGMYSQILKLRTIISGMFSKILNKYDYASYITNGPLLQYDNTKGDNDLGNINNFVINKKNTNIYYFARVEFDEALYDDKDTGRYVMKFRENPIL